MKAQIPLPVAMTKGDDNTGMRGWNVDRRTAQQKYRQSLIILALSLVNVNAI